MRELLILNSSKVAIVDDEDYEYLKQFEWRFSTTVFRLSATLKRIVPLANTILSLDGIVDHADRNNLNNQRYNLRPCSRVENNRNKTKRKNANSMFKGVELNKKTGNWRVRITPTLKSKKLALGTFESEVNAGIAYNVAAHRYYGEFAALNPLPTVFNT